MKKLLMLLCAGVIACSICSCGGNSEKTDTDNIETPPQVESTQTDK